jgi:hypothetical protein
MFSFYLFAKLFQNKFQKQPNENQSDTHLFTHFADKFQNVKRCVFDGFCWFFCMFSFYLSAKLFQNKFQKQPNENLRDKSPFTHFADKFPNCKRVCNPCVFIMFSFGSFYKLF